MSKQKYLNSTDINWNNIKPQLQSQPTVAPEIAQQQTSPGLDAYWEGFKLFLGLDKNIQALNKVMEYPKTKFSDAAKDFQKGDAINGMTNTFNGLLGLSAVPLVALGEGLRQTPSTNIGGVPLGGKEMADAIEYPFAKLSEGLSISNNFLGGQADKLGLSNQNIADLLTTSNYFNPQGILVTKKMIDETANNLQEAGIGATQAILAGAFGKTLATKFGKETTLLEKNKENAKPFVNKKTEQVFNQRDAQQKLTVDKGLEGTLSLEELAKDKPKTTFIATEEGIGTPKQVELQTLRKKVVGELQQNSKELKEIGDVPESIAKRDELLKEREKLINYQKKINNEILGKKPEKKVKTKKEKQNAVKEPSPEKVDVGEPPADGETLGKGNAKEEITKAGEEKVEQPKAGGGEVKTTIEGKGVETKNISDDNSFHKKLGKNAVEFDVMRGGAETSNVGRGGTWYENKIYEGQRSSYATGESLRGGVIGVGGKGRTDTKIALENPYYFDWGGLGEGKAVVELAKKVLGKEVTQKLSKGINGANAEKTFSKLEKTISDELGKQGYDGVVFYDKDLGNSILPKQTFKFESPKVEKQAGEEKVDTPKNVADHIIGTPRENLPSDISQKLKEQAENKLAEISGAQKVSQGGFRKQENLGEGYTTTSTQKPFTYSDFPEWFSSLGKSKQEVVNALQKIIEDKGKDKGKLVEDVKSVILQHLTEGEEVSILQGTSGKFKRRVAGKIPPDADVSNFVNRFSKDITKEELNKAFIDYETETKFPFGENEFDLTAPEVKTSRGKSQQIEIEGLGAPKFKGSEDYLKPKGKSEDTTPLFQQKNEAKGQTKLDQLYKDWKDLDKENPSGFNPKLLQKSIEIGIEQFKNGYNTFTEFSKKMISDLGEKIKPHLLRIWAGVKQEFAKGLLKIAEHPLNPVRPMKLMDESLFKQIDEVIKPNPKKIAKELEVPYTESWFGKGSNYIVKQSSKVVAKMGEGGKEFADKLNKMKDFEREFVGEPSEIAFDMHQLSKAEYKNLTEIKKARRFNKQEPSPITNNVKSMNEKINQYYDSLVSEYQKREIKTKSKSGKHEFIPLQNYEPRKLIFKLDDLGVERRADGKPIFNDKRNKIINSMVKEGKAKNNAEAAYILDNFIAKSRIKKAGNIEYARELDLPEKFYASDPAEILISYAASAGKRLGFIDNFGMKGEIASELLNKIRKDGYNENFARDLYRYETGQLTAQEHRMLQGINVAKGWQAVTKFTPFTTTRNALQGFLGSTTRGNLKAGIQGLLKAYTTEGKRSAYRSGALVDHIERIVQSDLAGGGELTGKYLDIIGFTGTDAFNRIISAGAGEVFYKDMLGRLKNNPFLKGRALREFEKMGLDANEIVKRGKFTPEELNLIKRTFAGDAQFNIRPSDLPLFWSSPTGKLLTQWKSFGYKMAQLVNDNILKEARHGNLMPLTTALIAYGVAGETVTTIIDYVREVMGNALKGKIDFSGKNAFDKSLFTSWAKKKDEAIALRIISDMSSLGAMGLFVDIIRSLGYGKSGVVGAVLGPTVGETVQTVEDVLAPTGQAITGDVKGMIPKTIQGVTKVAERNVPGAGILRTTGATKSIDTWTKETTNKIFKNSGTGSRTSTRRSYKRD